MSLHPAKHGYTYCTRVLPIFLRPSADSRVSVWEELWCRRHACTKQVGRQHEVQARRLHHKPRTDTGDSPNAQARELGIEDREALGADAVGAASPGRSV